MQNRWAREKSWYGEAAAALAFAGVSVPVTMAAGASLARALAVAIPFALLFTTTTLAVRVVILRVRGGGHPRATAATRRATLTISAVSIASIGAMTVAGWLPLSVLIASAPGLVTAAIVAARPPAPTRLRSLGWTLVAISTLTAVIVVATVQPVAKLIRHEREIFPLRACHRIFSESSVSDPELLSRLGPAVRGG